MTPEKLSINFVTLNKSHFYDQIEVTDEDLEAAYLEAQQAASEQADIETSHMLFLVNDSQTEEQALELANVAYNQLELGQDLFPLIFFALVTSVSKNILIVNFCYFNIGISLLFSKVIFIN